jgi:hypothetical protein
MNGLRYVPIVGNGFEPRLRGGASGFLVAPVDCYQFEGIYVFKDGSIYRAERSVSLKHRVIWTWLDNPLYRRPDRDEWSIEDFNARVEAMVVAEVTVQVRDFQRYIRPVERNAGPPLVEFQRLLEVSCAAA